MDKENQPPVLSEIKYKLSRYSSNKRSASVSPSPRIPRPTSAEPVNTDDLASAAHELYERVEGRVKEWNKRRHYI